MQQQTARYHPADYRENFPVASKWLPDAWRQAILDFYSYVRGLDEISDHPTLPREEKRQKLRVIRLGIQERNPDMVPHWAHPYLQMLFEKRLSAEYGDALWQAFWQDTEKDRYRSFADLLAYCRLSAAPVGRAVLAIANEPKPDLRGADALCIALQLLNHLQDARSDYEQRERIYLPLDWMEAEGLGEGVLGKHQTGPKLRRVFDQMLDETDKLLLTAKRLPKSIQQWRLRYEVRVILALAIALSRKLRDADPMSRRIALSRSEKKMAALRGLLGFY